MIDLCLRLYSVSIQALNTYQIVILQLDRYNVQLGSMYGTTMLFSLNIFNSNFYAVKTTCFGISQVAFNIQLFNIDLLTRWLCTCRVHFFSRPRVYNSSSSHILQLFIIYLLCTYIWVCVLINFITLLDVSFWGLKTFIKIMLGSIWPLTQKTFFMCLWTTKAQTSLHRCAVGSAPLIFAYWKLSYLDLLRAKVQFSS